jgi:two-component sensor histidine kinase
MSRMGLVVAVVSLVLSVQPAAETIAAEEVQVLVLSSHHNGLPWTDGFERGLRDFQRERPEVLYYFEYMYASRGDVSLTDEEWAEFLQTKFRDVPFDVIIADSGRAAALIRRYDRLFGPIPQVLVADGIGSVAEHQFSLHPDLENAKTRTAEIALVQNPEARSAIVIDQGFVDNEVSLEPLYAALGESSIDVQSLRIFSIDQLIDALETADPGDIAFYGPVFVDESGIRVDPAETLSRLAERSAVPIYTFWSTLVGHGAAGGAVIDAPSMAYGAMTAALRYRETGAFGSGYETIRPVFDDAVLQRHGVDGSSIPENAVLLNRREPFFRAHYVETITTVSAAALTALAVVVVLLRKNLRKNAQLRSQGMRLEAVVAEKEILFREMNHRVKNNLNILTSLVSLQMSATDDEASRGHLEGVAGKLRTMSLIHAKLQEGGDGAGFDGAEYLQSLAHQVVQTMRPRATLIRLDLHLEPIQMDVKVAVPCGLVVNELITNAIKYAFSGAAPTGTIRVELSSIPNDKVRLSVSDDGIGLPLGFDLNRDAGLGLKVVESLARQLRGTLMVRSDDGTTFAIEFPASSAVKSDGQYDSEPSKT